MPEEWWELSRASLESMEWNGVSGEVGPVEDEGPSHCQWMETGIIGSRKGHSSTRAWWHSMGREPMTHGSFCRDESSCFLSRMRRGRYWLYVVEWAMGVADGRWEMEGGTMRDDAARGCR